MGDAWLLLQGKININIIIIIVVREMLYCTLVVALTIVGVELRFDVVLSFFDNTSILCSEKLRSLLSVWIFL